MSADGGGVPPKIDREPDGDDDREFDWGAEDNIVCQRQPRTAVYSNPFDQIVIRQEAAEYGDDDPFVYFDRAHLPVLIAKLSEYLPAGVTVTSHRNAPERDVSPAALRQRRYRSRRRNGTEANPE